MRRSEKRQSDKKAKSSAALILGVLLAFGVELIVLMIGSVLVSAEIFRPDIGLQITAAACLIGCFAGGSLACRKWKSGKLLCGLLIGLFCFVLIFLIALMSNGDFEVGGQALVELAGCLIGGGLAGLLGRQKKKHKIR